MIAQLAAGTALWAQYRKDVNAGQEQASPDKNRLLNRPKNLLSQGVETVAADLDKPTTSIVAAKLTLARIALVSGNLEKAESWLVDAPMAVVDSVDVANPQTATVQVSEGFVRSVFETLFAIRTQRRDPAGAKAALEMMASKLGSSRIQFREVVLGRCHRLHRSTFLEAVVTSRTVFDTERVDRAVEKHDSTLTVPNVLWLGESWSRLARAGVIAQLARGCYAKAAAAYALAMNRADFPASSRAVCRDPSSRIVARGRINWWT